MRSESEIIEAEQEFFDRVWHERHLVGRYKHESGEEPMSEDIYKMALEAAERVRQRRPDIRPSRTTSSGACGTASSRRCGGYWARNGTSSTRDRVMSEPTTVKCGNCGEPVTDPPDGPRIPCPNCGSTAREFAASASIVATSSVTAEVGVVRGVNEARATVLFLLITIGLTVGFGAPWSWWARLIGSVVAVVASAVFVAVALRYPPVRHRMMGLMHRLTGQ